MSNELYCGKCYRELKTNRIGVAVLFCTKIDNHERQIQMADEKICPNCQHTMLVVNPNPAWFNSGTVAEKATFQEQIDYYKQSNKLVTVYE